MSISATAAHSLFYSLATQFFEQRPKSQTTTQGTYIVILSCVSEGIPTPKTYWKFISSNTDQVRSFYPVYNGSSHISIEKNNDLVIRNVQSSDEGKYFCFSSSPGILANVSATLIVNSEYFFVRSQTVSKDLCCFV